MMQQLFANPDALRNMINSNPMLQQMAQNNPQLQAALDNPQMLQMMGQMMSNPQMMGKKETILNFRIPPKTENKMDRFQSIHSNSI